MPAITTSLTIILNNKACCLGMRKSLFTNGSNLWYIICNNNNVDNN